MVKFKLELTRWARAVIQARPAHPWPGRPCVTWDEEVIDELLVKFDAALRLFHCTEKAWARHHRDDHDRPPRWCAPTPPAARSPRC